METATTYKYIVKHQDNAEPMVQGSRISVRDIVEQWKMGMSPEEVLLAYPHISLAQVFEALSYYQDNRDEIDMFIAKNKVPESLHGCSL